LKFLDVEKMILDRAHEASRVYGEIKYKYLGFLSEFAAESEVMHSAALRTGLWAWRDYYMRHLDRNFGEVGNKILRRSKSVSDSYPLLPFSSRFAIGAIQRLHFIQIAITINKVAHRRQFFQN
jgi:hypothetical protein